MTVKNEVELAVLTKEQAEAIETVRESHGKAKAVELHVEDTSGWGGQYWALNTLDVDKLVSALYVGYTVEKTQEEREADVKAYYWSQEGVHRHIAIIDTLNLLGITIAGVND